MLPQTRILLQINAPAIVLTLLEASFTYIYWAFAINVLGSVHLANLSVAVFWASVFLFELPTGYFVDRFGPKISIIFATSVRSMAFGFFFLSYQLPWSMWIANILAGIAVSIMSGLFILQIRLEFERQKLDIDYNQVSRSVTLVRGCGLFFGTLLGYWILRAFEANVIWLFACAMSLILLIIIVFSWSNLVTTVSRARFTEFRCSLQHSVVDRYLRSIIMDLSIWRAVMTLVGANIVLLYVPELDQAPVPLMGFYLLTGGITILSSYLRSYLILDNKFFLSLCALLSSVLLIFAVWTNGLFGLFSYALAIFFAGAVEQKIRADFIAIVPISSAGALTSVQSLVANAFTMIAFVFAGLTISIVGVSLVCFAAISVIVLRWSGVLFGNSTGRNDS